MEISLEQLNQWIQSRENETLEFKEARQQYDADKLTRYCAALANEGGGHIILGVSDQIPRRVVGTRAFGNLEGIKAELFVALHIRVDASEIHHPDGRVVVFSIPPRPRGLPVLYKGASYMRAGEYLVAMTPDQLKRIFEEATPDFSAELCPKACLTDLDPQAIQRFRAMWQRKSGNQNLNVLSDEQLLTDAELVVNGQLTYSALVLFGTRQALGKHLAQAEVVFEYRATEASGPAHQRAEYRQGFFLFHDDLWSQINLRNDVQHYQAGFFIWDIPTFNEVVVREAVLNAISHRDYRFAGSVFVRQFPRRLEIVSPGGFPPGITQENVLWRQCPRNRRIAEAFAKCGLVERSGQGVRRMFEESIKESKPTPDFADTDDHQVSIVLRGEVQDPRFVQFLERIGRETLTTFATQDFLILDALRREETIGAAHLKRRLPTLMDQGVIERVGRGRGTRYILSRQLYTALEKTGTYTRVKGLDRDTNKALLLKHIRDNAEQGSRLHELRQVLPSLTGPQVQTLLVEMKGEGKVCVVGRTKSARWYSVLPYEKLSNSR